jgi:hypothetical protein
MNRQRHPLVGYQLFAKRFLERKEVFELAYDKVRTGTGLSKREKVSGSKTDWHRTWKVVMNARGGSWVRSPKERLVSV